MSPPKGSHHTEEAKRKLSVATKEAWKRQPHPMLGKHNSLETRGRISAALKGKRPSEETRRKWSESRRGEGNPMYGKTHTPEVRAKLAEVQRMRRGWHHTEETKRKISQSKIGVKRQLFDEKWKARLSESGKGRIFSEEHRQNLSRSFTQEHKQNLSKSMRGINNPLWQGGKSFEPYSPEFHNQLKAFVRQRDGYSCQLCGILEVVCGKSLDIHHIDYNKKNSQTNNLIALCNRCNNKVNFTRKYWTIYFQEYQQQRR